MIKNMEIDTEHYDLSDDLNQRIQDKIAGLDEYDKIAGLDEYMDTLGRGHVTMSWLGGTNEQTRIRAQVSASGHQFDVSDTDWNAVTAIDKTHSKPESQIRKVHEKSISKRDHDSR